MKNKNDLVQVYYFIYKTTNLIDNMIYVGKHTQNETSAFDGYLGGGILINKAVKKYGRKNFIRETIEFCTYDNIDDREIYWINTLNATNRNIGYNITTGGDGIRIRFKENRIEKDDE